LDVGGVVNAYYTSTRTSGDAVTVIGGVNSTGARSENNITTGLLPNVLSISGKSRQNDLDIGFTIAINPGASTTNSAVQNDNPNGRSGGSPLNQENRQAFLTIGDASWGSVKLGKDLGVYASDAILNDMTLLGVGSAAGGLAGNTTTLGRIGTGFIYADWKAQVAYTTPNWNGFQATVAATQAWNTYGAGFDDIANTNVFGSATSTGRGGAAPAVEAKASYAWTGDVSGKVWSSFFSQKVTGMTATAGGLNNTLGTTGGATLGAERATAMDVGANINLAGFGLTSYYNKGRGTGTTVMLRDGFDSTGKRRDSDDWYVQATYALPTATKVGVAYGQSTLEGNTGETFSEYKNSMWTVGAYHPLTKSMNLVAEYSNANSEVNLRNAATLDGKSRTVSLGAILFF
jgi:predicted porin